MRIFPCLSQLQYDWLHCASVADIAERLYIILSCTGVVAALGLTLLRVPKNAVHAVGSVNARL